MYKSQFEASEDLNKSKEHYHYLIGYNFKLNNGDFGFGDVKIITALKILHTEIDRIRVSVLEVAKKENKEINSIVILAISPLGCGCENEN